MSAQTLHAQVKSLEAQLAVLKAQVKALRPNAPSHTFADLEGLLAGKVHTTEEEIEAAKYRVKWDDEEGGGQ